MWETGQKLSHLNDIDLLPVFDILSEGIIIVDADGIIRYYNKRMEKIDDIEAREVVLKKVTDVYDITDDTSKIMQTLITQKPIIDEAFIYRTKMGKVVNSIHSAFPLYKEGELIGAICFTRDYKLLEDTVITAPTSQKLPFLTDSSNFTFDNIVGTTPEFKAAINTAKMVVDTPSPVMICGMTGTGKELFARSIHNLSSRKKNRFTPVNCAAIPENLLEGILFGTSKGAFTGSTEKPGLFEATNGGTIFLDELNSMPIGLQAKILRVIQEKRIRRVGSLKEIKLDIKILSSVNEEPYRSISNGTLRPDLFYRLGVVFIKIPSLKERIADLETLIQHFLNKHNKLMGKKIRRISREVLDVMKGYDWPGNVRELEHVIEGAMNIVENGKPIEMRHMKDKFTSLPESLSASPTQSEIFDREETEITEIKPRVYRRSKLIDTPGTMPKRIVNAKVKAQSEELLLKKMLREHQGNITNTAASLGISRQLLNYKLKKYGISRLDYVE